MTFKVTSGPVSFNGDLVGTAAWSANGAPQSASMAERVRNTAPVKINEFRIGTGADLVTSGVVGWGANDQGQLGTTGSPDCTYGPCEPSPKAVGLANVQAVAVGGKVGGDADA